MSNVLDKKVSAELDRLDSKYGHKTGALGSDSVHFNSISTGILSLDSALGTGGWPKGYLVEVYGPPDIGKSSIIGFSAIKEAQRAGSLCGILALEPNFDKEWAIKNGVDPEKVIIARPNNGEDAFNLLYDWVTDDLIDVVLFDSIGAVLRSSEIEKEVGSAKPAQGGQAALITWGVKRVVQPVWKNNKVVIFANQVRDIMNSTYGGLDSPGGHALKHSCSQRVQLKPGKDRFYETIDGDKVMVGREIIAEVARNKLSEGNKQRAVFNFYSKEVEDHAIGVDIIEDIIRTGKRVGSISNRGAWFYSEYFPDGKLQGKNGVKEYLKSNSEVVQKMRQDILSQMVRKNNEG